MFSVTQIPCRSLDRRGCALPTEVYAKSESAGQRKS
jgi:hypothetical protein